MLYAISVKYIRTYVHYLSTL